MTHKKLNLILGWAVFTVSFAIFLSTMQPSLPFWDCGEFVAVAHTMGVPHPPGSPLFTILGRFTSLLITPFTGDPATSLNFLSVLLSSFGVMLAYFTIVRLNMIYKKTNPSEWVNSEKIGVYTSAVIGAFSIGFSFTYWFSAVESEVYAASIFLFALSFWAILRWWEDADAVGSDKWILFCAFIFGVMLGTHIQALLSFFSVAVLYAVRKNYDLKNVKNLLFFGSATIGLFLIIYPGIVKYSILLIKKTHPIVVLIIPLVLLYLSYKTYKLNQRTWHLFATSLFLLVLGYSSYTTIYYRAKVNPPINENAPNKLDKMLSYLSREQYGANDQSIFKRRASTEPANQRMFKKYKSDWDYFWNYQVEHMYLRYLGWNFIGKDGDRQDNKTDYREFWFLPLLIGLLGVYMSFKNNFGVGLGLLALFGMSGLVLAVQLNMPEPQPRERDYAFVGSFYAFGLWIGLGMAGIYDYIRKWLFKDEKRSLIAVSLASLLGLAFINARMVQVNYFENSRAGNYAPYDYAFNILQSCEKDGIIFTNGDNDTFPLWYMQEAMGVRQDVRVVNLSLANTDWYIKQLINEEPRGAKKIRMNLNQTDLEKFSYQPWSARDISLQINKLRMMQEMKEMYLRRERQLLNVSKEMLPSLLPDVMTWRFEPTVNYQGQGYIRLQDRVVFEIIMNNLNDRPVYFSVTVSEDNRIGIDDFLQLEGYAFRVVPIKAKGDVEPNINYQKMMRIFQYRNFTSKDVYYDEVARRMIGQYKSVFLQAASSFAKSPKDTTLIQDETGKFIPRTNKEIAEEITDFTLQTVSTEIWETPFYNTVSAIEVYAEIGSRAKAQSLLAEAESLVLKYVEENPNDLMSKYYLAKAYKSLEDTDKAVELLEEVQKGYPDDRNIQNEIMTLKTMKKIEANIDSSNKKIK